MKEIFEKEIQREEPLIPSLIRKLKHKKKNQVSRRVRKKLEEIEMLKLEIEKTKLERELKEENTKLILKDSDLLKSRHSD